MEKLSERHKILIVDDITENLLALEKILSKLDVDVVRAHSGNQALQATLYNDFSLIILDVIMPGMSGVEVAELLKEDESTSGIPIIFITAMDKDESYELKAYGKGAIDFLYKPYNQFVLLSKVQILLDLYAMKRNLEHAIYRTTTEKPKILVVDDHPENVTVLKRLLSKLDVEVISALSGNEALTETLYNDFAVIFLDVMMPGMGGYEVAELLKSNEKTASIPIIFLTAIDRDDAKEIQGYDRGAVDFIFKPFNEYILLSKARVFIDIYKLRSGLEEMVSERTIELRKINKQLKKEIAQKKAAEERLVRTKSYLESVVNSMLSMLIGCDRQGVIANMNMKSEEISGISAKEAKGQTIGEVFPYFSNIIPDMLGYVDNNKPVEKTKVAIDINDNERICNITVFPLIGKDENQVVIRVDDVTDQIRFEEMVVESEKMLTIGGLAAGMAHEINNPIAGIVQNLLVLQNRTKGGMAKNIRIAEECGTTMEAIEAYLEKRGIPNMISSAVDSVNRAVKVINNMLSFSRKTKGELQPNNLGDIVEQAIEMASSDYEMKKKYGFRDIEINRQFDDNLLPVLCEASKIQQVILNILKNGAQAMCGEGVGSEFERDQQKEPKFSIRLTNIDNSTACLEIEDNGPGMKEEVRKRAFDPFFTTKPVGEGTGLGLFVCYFIITGNHRGTISLDTLPGKGAKFTIRLPFWEERG